VTADGGELTISTVLDVNPRSGLARKGKKNDAMDKPAVSAAAADGRAAKNDKPVSLVVDDAPVAQVLQTLAEMKQKSRVAPDVSGTVSLHLKKVPWQQALRAVIDSAGLALNSAGHGPVRAYSGLAKGAAGAEAERRSVCRICLCRGIA
jgi:type II secretory pathway component GspD/PulD (secretin)